MKLKFPPRKKTMTLNMTEKEMAVLTAMAEKKGMTKTQIMRQALRTYQMVTEGKIEMKDREVFGCGGEE